MEIETFRDGGFLTREKLDSSISDINQSSLALTKVVDLSSSKITTESLISGTEDTLDEKVATSKQDKLILVFLGLVGGGLMFGYALSSFGLFFSLGGVIIGSVIGTVAAVKS